MTYTKLAAAGAIAVLTSGLSAPANAQETITLKIADIFPTTHYIVTEGTQRWMDKASELSGGRLKFEYYPAQQLGKAADILSLTQSGVADIGAVAPAYTPEKLPLTVVGELPGAFETACAGSYALTQLGRHDGLLGKAEYEPQGVRVLYANMLAPYTVMTSRTPIEKISDLQGLKIYASGGAKDITLRALGVVPIRLTGPELFQATQRGTIDGTMLAYIGLRPYELHTLLRYGMTGVNLGSTAVTYVINEERWAALPEDMQNILIEAADYATDTLCSHSDSKNESEMEALESAGAKILRLEGQVRDDLVKLVEPVTSRWAEELDARGMPASDAVAAFHSKVEEYNAKQ